MSWRVRAIRSASVSMAMNVSEEWSWRLARRLPGGSLSTGSRREGPMARAHQHGRDRLNKNHSFLVARVVEQVRIALARGPVEFCDHEVDRLRKSPYAVFKIVVCIVGHGGSILLEAGEVKRLAELR
jgi:hypothetical protein